MLPVKWAKRLKMQESLQIALCRLVFVSLALLPFIAVILYSCWTFTPWHHLSLKYYWQQQISSAIGFDVDIESVVNYSPHETRLKNLKLLHPETGDLVAVIDTVELRPSNDRYRLKVIRPQFHLEYASQLSDAVHRHSLCLPRMKRQSFLCSIENAKLRSEVADIDGITIESELKTSSDRSQLRSRFELKTTEGAKVGTLDVVREHLALPPLTTCQMDFTGVEIPAIVLHAFQPFSKHLGSEVAFQGTVVTRATNSDWDIWISGALRGVQWEQITSSLAYQILGRGDIHLNEAWVFNGQLRRANGALSAKQGSISRTWLDQARNYLRLRMRPDILQGDIVMVPFEIMKVQFDVSELGVRIDGGIPQMLSTYQRSLISNGAGPIVFPANENLLAWGDVSRWLRMNPEGIDGLWHSSVQTAVHVNDQILANNSHKQLELARWLARVLPSHSVANEGELRSEAPVAAASSTTATR